MPLALIADVSRVTATLCSLVRAEGLEPVVVAGGAEAVEWLAHNSPRIAIVNPSLTGIDGFAVIRELRKLAPEVEVPAVIVSAIPAMRARARQLRTELGISTVISADLEPHHIRESLRDALEATHTTHIVELEDIAGPNLREAARLTELERLALADGARPDPQLQREVDEIAHTFGVSTVLVSLVLRDRQYFAASHGLPDALAGARTAPREGSFCRHVVESDHPEPLIVPNAYSHPLFSNNPLVRAGLLGSYVGVPLETPSGHVLGTLCVADTGPWLGSQAMVDALTARAREVTASLLAARS